MGEGIWWKTDVVYHSFTKVMTVVSGVFPRQREQHGPKVLNHKRAWCVFWRMIINCITGASMCAEEKG